MEKFDLMTDTSSRTKYRDRNDCTIRFYVQNGCRDYIWGLIDISCGVKAIVLLLARAQYFWADN
eukprot:scaffold29512_cov76-Skeletonema_dohrnii-CCMP3373.AAC.3